MPLYHYSYDGTFEGLLSVIFEVYERKAWPGKIMNEQQVQPSLFVTHIPVITNEEKAERVWQGLLRKISANAGVQLYKVFLSELPDMEMVIYQYIKLAFDSLVNIEENFAADCVRVVAQINKQIFREAHRMEAFVRFQKTGDNLFYAGIEPDFNVIPLLQKHFAQRYADQRWLIYDLKRRYGIYYNLDRVEYVQLEQMPINRSGQLNTALLDEDETAYQELWQTYFNSVNIPERKNKKLHLRHIPVRYWKYLAEKQPVYSKNKA
ncbi:TIGR03915 family putative DNA repair protein [Adhaeribacter radiodurans]|uniref:TIGR03915 family putative DNA repair protein n=1 Tax=Adhaeribacter radiodurans TaxID=2745197 RepID=A0A7L7LB87_9BACT|nr:TIGR03915 family putative DNA repair protein [Adhaeribacter radiodurans]QMU29997.1 TIGR03915 family putative DNA repair protein [Adhaeribacter radiodurans]